MDLYEIFRLLNIQVIEILHNAVYTAEQAKSIKFKISGIGCKNLFLTNKKGKYVLVVIEENKKANIKELAKIINVNHLSFANNIELESILKLQQGSVTPLGIINDIDNKVLILIDKDLEGKRLLVHPNTNIKTISIDYNDLIKFIEYENHDYILI